MRCNRLWLVPALLLAGLAAPAQADWQSFWDRVHLDWHRMNCYPEPFIQADRQSVRAPLFAQENAGWRVQNTLGNQHFDPTTQKLNRSGEIKLRWILVEAPEARRTVYVLDAENLDESSIRVDSVQQAASRLIPQGPLPDVARTHIEPRGWPADYIDAIGRKASSTIPNPRLPGMTDTTNGN